MFSPSCTGSKVLHLSPCHSQQWSFPCPRQACQETVIKLQKLVKVCCQAACRACTNRWEAHEIRGKVASTNVKIGSHPTQCRVLQMCSGNDIPRQSACREGRVLLEQGRKRDAY